MHTVITLQVHLTVLQLIFNTQKNPLKFYSGQ